MGKRYKAWWWLVWLLLACLSALQVWQQPAWSPMMWQPIAKAQSDTPFYAEQLIDNAGEAMVHSVSATVLPSGDVMAFWFAGTREGHKDVRIFHSTFSQQQAIWSTPQAMLDVAYLDDVLGRYIGKIGNPLVFLDSRQRLWLFFVTVSYGGWAGSSLNVMWSEDLGEHWNTPKRLITSPFINVSTLVRNNLFELQDGSLLLPVYHEFVAQFPELLRISPQGEVMSKTRMTGHGGGIQPVLFEGQDGEVEAYMRSGSHTKDWRVISLKSQDQGQTWHDFKLTKLPNPNSALIAQKVDDHLWIWLGNWDERSRQDMTLAVSNDLHGDWQVVHRFELTQGDERFAYPTISQDQRGIWHVLYTYNRKNIKHIRFNLAWLQKQISLQGKQP